MCMVTNERERAHFVCIEASLSNAYIRSYRTDSFTPSSIFKDYYKKYFLPLTINRQKTKSIKDYCQKNTMNSNIDLRRYSTL